jgi:hypothetical protein
LFPFWSVNYDDVSEFKTGFLWNRWADQKIAMLSLPPELLPLESMAKPSVLARASSQTNLQYMLNSLSPLYRLMRTSEGKKLYSCGALNLFIKK